MRMQFLSGSSRADDAALMDVLKLNHFKAQFDPELPQPFSFFSKNGIWLFTDTLHLKAA
ncbi:MAG: hypothetical protein ACYCSN_06760 [Acidobacteriaceae bacterium]